MRQGNSLIADLVILLDLLKGGERGQVVGPSSLVGASHKRDRGLASNIDSRLVVFPVVVVLAAHLGILLDLLPTGLAAGHSTAHSTCGDTAEGDQDRGSEDDPCPPSHVGDKDENVDDEGQEADEEGDDNQDEKDEQVSRRVGGSVEVRCDGHDKHDKTEEGSDRVNDQNRHERASYTVGQVEGIWLVPENTLCDGLALAVHAIRRN